MDQEKFLNQLEDQLHKQIDIVVCHYQNLTESELLFQKDETSWSIAHCIEHLNTYSNYYLPLIQNSLNKLQNENNRDMNYKAGFLGAYFIKKINPITGKNKMKAHKKHYPIINSDVSQIISKHLNYQEELVKLIRNSSNVNLNKKTIPVSIFKPIKLSIGDTLHFIIEHNARHLIQASKNISKSIQ